MGSAGRFAGHWGRSRQSNIDVGLYHPRVEGGITTDLACLPRPKRKGDVKGPSACWMRSYVLSGDTGHFDGVIAAFEARGLRVIPAFASGLDARPAVERYFRGASGRDRRLGIMTGFSLVGGPAYNDADAARAVYRAGCAYVVAQPLGFSRSDPGADRLSRSRPQ